MTIDCDIAIIGAGPAGTACALALQGSGLRVALIDQAAFPRDKICGDAIPGDAFRAMDAIRPEWGRAMRQFADGSVVRASRGVAPNGRSLTMHWTLFSYNSRRRQFDHFLWELVRKETATQLLPNRRLQSVDTDSDRVHGRFQDGSELTAKLLIGCDGANSIVSRRLLGYRPGVDASCVAVRAYYHGVGGTEAGTNEFHFFKDLLPGYFWIFPLQDGWVNAGFGLLSGNGRELKTGKSLRRTLESIIKEQPRIAPRFRHAVAGGGIRGFALPLGTRFQSASGQRFMLCGDAAALINPLWGHGIDTAMWSGVLAARRALACFEDNDFSSDVMAQYDREIQRKWGRDFRRHARAMRLFQRFPGLLNTAFAAAAQPGIRRLLQRFS